MKDNSDKVSTFVKKNRFLAKSFVKAVPQRVVLAGLLCVAGLLTGMVFGYGALSGFMSGRGSLLAMYAVPGPELWDIRRAAHDRDSFRRAASCYALAESGGDYGAFFLQRLRQEKVPFVQRALLWGLAASNNAPEVLPDELPLEPEMRNWYALLRSPDSGKVDNERRMNIRLVY